MAIFDRKRIKALEEENSILRETLKRGRKTKRIMGILEARDQEIIKLKKRIEQWQHQ